MGKHGRIIKPTFYQEIKFFMTSFFELIQVALGNRKVLSKPPTGSEWERIYSMAEEQSVIGLMLCGIEKLPKEQRPPQKQLLQCIGVVQMIEQQNKAMNEFLAELIGNLRQSGIYTLLVKGQGIAQCYEKPLWRACGDVDLLLSKINYDRAKELLVPLASSVETEYIGNRHLGMMIDGWVVELHGTLHSELSGRIDRELDEIVDSLFYTRSVRSWMNGKTQVFLPRADEDVVYVFTHILQHFFKGGVGLRQICDWSRLLCTYKDSIDQGLLELRIRRMGLMSEWRAFGSFAVIYLGMSSTTMPLYSAEKRWKRKADMIYEFVMKVGNMGHNRDNSFYGSKPYLMRKTIALGRRCKDMWCHARLFPMDSLRFFTNIVYNGLRSAVRGE